MQLMKNGVPTERPSLSYLKFSVMEVPDQGIIIKLLDDSIVLASLRYSRCNITCSTG